MHFPDRLVIILGQIISKISKLFHIGAGGTWPGEIALLIRPNIAVTLASQLRKGVILVAGTNGKTTTSLMITKILEEEGLSVVHNASGANLLNGIVSALIQKSKADWGVFEADENSLPTVVSSFENRASGKRKLIIVLLNLFRDQLDRYGEVDVIVEKWQHALSEVEGATYILNADDPAISYIGKKAKGKVLYFGVNAPKHFLPHLEHATDSTFCLNCGGRLRYEGIYYSHIGIWHCEKCGEKRPKPDIDSWDQVLPGFYNHYNTLAAVATAIPLGISKASIKKALGDFSPAFGRQEEFEIKGKKIKIFLSKNPAGFNASLRSALELGAKQFLFVLNDRIPDGRDVSWIWDVDFEMVPSGVKIFVGGDRVYDLSLRLKYAQRKPVLTKTVYDALREIEKGDTLFVLPTYSAMLEVRKILVGRKIL